MRLNKTYAKKITKKRKKFKRWQIQVITLCIVSTVVAWNFIILANMYLEAYTPSEVLASEVVKVEQSIKEYIFREVEQKINFDEAVTAMNIINCESRFNVDAIGINSRSVDLGVWQINTIHKDISNADKLDYKKATKWAIAKRIKDGNWNAWTCNR